MESLAGHSSDEPPPNVSFEKFLQFQFPTDGITPTRQPGLQPDPNCQQMGSAGQQPLTRIYLPQQPGWLCDRPECRGPGDGFLIGWNPGALVCCVGLLACARHFRLAQLETRLGQLDQALATSPELASWSGLEVRPAVLGFQQVGDHFSEASPAPEPLSQVYQENLRLARERKRSANLWISLVEAGPHTDRSDPQVCPR